MSGDATWVLDGIVSRFRAEESQIWSQTFPRLLFADLEPLRIEQHKDTWVSMQMGPYWALEDSRLHVAEATGFRTHHPAENTMSYCTLLLTDEVDYGQLRPGQVHEVEGPRALTEATKSGKVIMLYYVITMLAETYVFGLCVGVRVWRYVCRYVCAYVPVYLCCTYVCTLECRYECMHVCMYAIAYVCTNV